MTFYENDEHSSCGIEGQCDPLWIQCSYKSCLQPWDSDHNVSCCTPSARRLSQWWMLFLIMLGASSWSHMCSDCSSPPPDDIEWKCPHLWCWHD